MPFLRLAILVATLLPHAGKAQQCTGQGNDPYASGGFVPCCSWLENCLGDHYNNNWWHYRCYECCADPHNIDCSPPWSPPTPPRSAPATKRGIAVKEVDSTDLQSLTNAISWGYTWQVVPDRASLDDWDATNIDFVPMVWGAGHVTRGDITSTPPDAQALLGFNEPNFPDQANMLPSDAANLWPNLEAEAAAKNIPILVSPAVNFAAYNPINWLDEFFGNCTGCQVDAIAMHSYTCRVQYLHNHISLYYKYGKPIWLTEFACVDEPARQNAAGQAEYMKEAIPYLEQSPNVAKYAWFSYNFGPNGAYEAALFDANGDLTPLGELYRDLGGDPYYAEPTDAPTNAPVSSPPTSAPVTSPPTAAPVEPPTKAPVPAPCTGNGGDPYQGGGFTPCCASLQNCLADHFGNGWWHYRCYGCCAANAVCGASEECCSGTCKGNDKCK